MRTLAVACALLLGCDSGSLEESAKPGNTSAAPSEQGSSLDGVPMCQPSPYEGIGAAVERTPRGIEITGLTAGAPAQRAGMQVGDLIGSIDGADVASLSLEAVHARLLGAAGTDVTLRVRRADAPISLTVTRARLGATCVADADGKSEAAGRH